MIAKLSLSLSLALISVGLVCPVRGSSQEPVPTATPAADKPTPAPAPQAAAPAAPAAKLASPQKPHVYTNDDLKGGSDSGGLDFSQINNCDRNCFDQIRQLSHFMPAGNWKREVLKAIDVVRKDTEWQQYLTELYNMHMKYCALGEAKRSELNHLADPHNVTPQELSIDEKYDAKFRELQTSMQSLTSKQGALILKFSASPFSVQFANLQVSRVSNASCGGPSYIGPDEGEDP